MNASSNTNVKSVQGPNLIMRIGSLALLLLILIALCFRNYQQQESFYRQRLWETYTLSGNRSVANGDVAQSIQCFRAAQQVAYLFAVGDWRRAKSDLNLGCALLQDDKFLLAKNLLERALTVLPQARNGRSSASEQENRLECLHGLGIATFKLRQFEQAERWLTMFEHQLTESRQCETAINYELIGDSIVDSKLVLASIYKSTGKLEQARRLSSETAHFSANTVSPKMRRLLSGDSSDDKTEISNIDETSLRRLMLLGELDLLLHKDQQSEEYFRQAMKIAPKGNELMAATHCQSQALIRSSQFARAQQCLQNALAVAPSRRDRFIFTVDLANMYEARGDFRKAEQTFMNLIANRQGRLDEREQLLAKNELARLYEDENKPAEARRLFLEVLVVLRQRLGDDPLFLTATLKRLMDVCTALKLKEEYRSHCEELVRCEESSTVNAALPGWLMWMGHAYLGLDEYESARKCFTRVLELTANRPESSDYVSAHGLVAYTLKCNGRAREQLPYLENQVKLTRTFRDPGDEIRTNAIIGLALGYASVNEDAQCISVLMDELKGIQSSKQECAPGVDQLVQALSQAFFRQKNYVESRKFAAEAARLIGGKMSSASGDLEQVKLLVKQFVTHMDMNEHELAGRDVSMTLQICKRHMDSAQFRVWHVRGLFQRARLEGATGDKVRADQTMEECYCELLWLSGKSIEGPEHNEFGNLCQSMVAISGDESVMGDAGVAIRHLALAKEIWKGFDKYNKAERNTIEFYTLLVQKRLGKLTTDGNSRLLKLVCLVPRDSYWHGSVTTLAGLLMQKKQYVDEIEMLSTLLRETPPSDELCAVSRIEWLRYRCIGYLNTGRAQLGLSDVREALEVCAPYLKKASSRFRLLQATVLVEGAKCQHSTGNSRAGLMMLQPVGQELLTILHSKDPGVKLRRVRNTLIMCLHWQVDLARATGDAAQAAAAESLLTSLQTKPTQ